MRREGGIRVESDGDGDGDGKREGEEIRELRGALDAATAEAAATRLLLLVGRECAATAAEEAEARRRGRALEERIIENDFSFY